MISIIAVVSPFCASITALGITLLLQAMTQNSHKSFQNLLEFEKFQIHLNVMMLVIPFLILAVGVDDAFLLLGAWHHNKHRTDRVERLKATYDQVMYQYSHDMAFMGN